ncbi:hypothetical protein CMI47_06695 [Candidatus Pacearchaeota archaeon]|nr:hypothetical protein [Candidatus Pacearchaeota archaeon]|tara:strand:- start:6150 stop:7685 length:1536 start_codon:yes stop_codon:yes gene_type:complete
MYRILSSSSDTYITNKIINSSFRATDANVGAAGTLDLFKLYDESLISGTDAPTEISRILIKFDLSHLKALTGTTLDIANPSFSCTLKLHDVYGGQTTPSNFNVIVFPLSRSFDEGIGRDVVTFEDIDSCNFQTASISSGKAVKWYLSGANKDGLLGSDDIDIISSGNLSDGNGTVNLWKSQAFNTGDEDLSVDVTTIVSATLAGQIPDHGFRLSFSGSEETDHFTRFVKRFASRHSTNTRKRPKLIVRFNDAIQDHHEIFFFDVTGSLFLNNFHRGSRFDILSGVSATKITGTDCLLVTMTSGSTGSSTFFSRTFSGSQHKIGNNFMSGVYSSTFSISEFESGTLRNEIVNAGSATFTEIWSSLDKTVGYFTGSIVVNTVKRSAFINSTCNPFINITNLKSSYRRSQKVKFRVFVEDINDDLVLVKKPIKSKSKTFTKMHYRIKDFDSGDIIIPFDTEKGGTLLSTDSEGMYFEFYMDSLQPGRTYGFDFFISDSGVDQIFSNVATKFKVE